MHESLFTAYLVTFADARKRGGGMAQCGQGEGGVDFYYVFADDLYG